MASTASSLARLFAFLTGLVGPATLHLVILMRHVSQVLHEDERMGISWSLRPATPEDAEWMADLKATAMRPDLERLGYWDRGWARERFLEAYVPANTYVVLVEGTEAGLIAVRTATDRAWVEHFYLAPRLQGHGLGGNVLAHVMELHQDLRPFWLAIDHGSRARQLYEHHGFTYRHTADNGVDQLFSTDPRMEGDG